MSRLTILDEIEIASPCGADWTEMAGDERARLCGSCSKHVYNIAAMTAEEATALIVNNEGRVCLRLFKRADGTVMTADCPVGLANVAPARRYRRALAMALVVPALLAAGASAFGFGDREINPFPTGPGATWSDRLDWALITLGIKSPPRMVMGEMIMGEPAAMPLPPATPGSPAPVCPVEVEPGDEP